MLHVTFKLLLIYEKILINYLCLSIDHYFLADRFG